MSSKSFKIENCRVCNGKLKVILDLGKQPIANKLQCVSDDIVQYDEPEKYPLKQAVCEKCQCVQLLHTVDKKVLFDNYLYRSSCSKELVDHFKELAETISKYKYDKVLDIGANDGILVKPLRKLGVKATGLEPEKKFCDDKTIFNGWIDDWKTLDKLKKYDVIIGSNVFAHIHDINSAIKNVKRLLEPDGLFIIEVQYLKSMVDYGLFDMIYHEHIFYWSVTAIKNLLQKHGMYISKLERISTHGGSIRVYANKGCSIHEEIIDKFDFEKYEIKVKSNIFVIESILKELLSDEEEIVIYGVPAKATVMFNLMGPFWRDEYAIDDNEYKQGKLIPGTDILIKPCPKEIDADIVFIAAWNCKDSIIKKCRKLGYKGKFFVPLPIPEIL